MRKTFLHVLVILATLTSVATHSQTDKRGSSFAKALPLYGPALQEPAETMPLVAPIFLQTDEIDTRLTIVNGIDLDTPALIVARDMSGDKLLEKHMLFPAHSSTVISTASLLKQANSGAHSGSLSVLQDVSIKGPALVGQVSITVHSGNEPAYLEEELGMPTMHGSQVLRGVASQTTHAPLVAISSNSEAPQTVTLTCLGQQKSASIEVPAYGTAVVRACVWDQLKDSDLALSSSLSSDETPAPRDYALQLSTDAAPGSYYAFGLALNGKLGNLHMQPLDFYDPGQAYSSSITYVGVPLGADSLLSSGSYTPTVTLATFSSQQRNVRVVLADSSSLPVKLTTVAKMQLGPLTAQTIKPLINDESGLLHTFTIESDGNPGEVQAHLFSGNAGSESRVEMLAKDPLDPHDAGNHPWSIGNGQASTLILYNPTAQPVPFTIRLSGHTYQWTQIVTLQPKQTREFSINDIVHEQVLGLEKQKVPAQESSGEVLWSTQSGGSGLGRLLISSGAMGLSRSYSCQTYTAGCGLQLTPQSYASGPVGSLLSFYDLQAILCTEYSPFSCAQSSPSGTSYNINSNCYGGNNSSTTISYAGTNSLDLNAVAIGTFSISASATAGSCNLGTVYGNGAVTSPMTTSPVVSFDVVDDLGVGTSETVAVHVRDSSGNNVTSAYPITIKLNSSGAGMASLQGPSTTFTGESTITLTGSNPSSVTGDLELDATYSDGEGGSRSAVPNKPQFSVVSVTLSVKFSGMPAPDNNGVSALESIGFNDVLGPGFQTNTSSGVTTCAVSYEIEGRVTPADYAEAIVLTRARTVRGYQNGTTILSESGVDDTSQATVQDQLPQSGGSAGVVYDLDTPGPNFTGTESNGTVRNLRVNFTEQARLGNTTSSIVSAPISFFTRSSCKTGANSSEGYIQFDNSIAGDNSGGVGSTPLSLNLQ